MTSVIIAAAEPQKLDNRIKMVEVQSEGFTHYADNSNVRAEFIADANAVVFESRGQRIKWTPRSIKYVDAWGMEDTIYSVQNVPLEIKANYARFNRAFPDVDDWFIVENDRLKHQILVQGFQRDPFELLDPETTEFVVSGALAFDADLAVRADGMTLTGAFETSGGIEILDGDNVIFTLPRIIAKDSHFEKRAVAYGKYRVTANEGGVLAFDIVMDNEWIASEERVYPIVIDPTIVSMTANAINVDSGTTQRMIRLGNGWLIVSTHEDNGTNNWNYLRVSKDDGVTWQQLCYANQGTLSNACQPIFPSTTNATTFYLINTALKKLYKIDAATQTNVDIASGGYAITGGGMSYANAAMDSAGKIWVAYSNGGTFFYTTTTNDGATFTTPVTLISSSHTWRAMKVVLKSDGTPLIVAGIYFSANNPAGYGIQSCYWNGTSFTAFSDVSQNGALGGRSEKPSVVVDANNTVHVFWYGYSAGATSGPFNIHYTRSTDWGATWSPRQAVTTNTSSSNYYPAAAISRVTGDIYVFYRGSNDGETTNTLRYVRRDAASGSFSAITSLTTTAVTYQSAIFENPSVWNNTSDKARFVYIDFANSSALTYDFLSLNTAPLAPSALSRPNYDATQSATFSYQFNDTIGDTISAHEAEIVDTATGNVVYTLAKTGTATTSFTVAANTLTNGKTYQWRVRTYDAGGLQSPWSAYASLKCAVAPQVSVTDPVANQLVSGDSITVYGSYVQSAGSPQKSFRFRLYDATDALLQDSGVISGATNAKTFAGLTNNTTYKVEFTATSNDDITATSAKVSFSVQYTPPATPTVTATNNSESATVTVTFANPAPSGDQPAVDHNDVYRRKVGATDWTLIATGATSPYTDRTCPAGTYEYGVRAVAASGAVSEYGTAQVAHSFAGHRVVDESTGETLSFVYNVDGADITIEDDSQAIKTFGGVFVRRTPNRYKRGTLSALYVDSAEDVMARVGALDRMAASDSLYLLKLSHGEGFKVSLSRVRYKAQHAGMTADVSVEWTKGGVE